MPGEIHKTAIVSPKAEIADNVSIGPFCLIGEGVTIKKGSKLISNVIIEGNTEIGERNIVREYASIHRASVSGDGVTEIGDENFIMAYVHIAHDCKIGSSVALANAATLAGHVVVEDFAFIGGVVAIHQFTRIGAYSMVGGFSGIGQDIPPFTMASGPRAKLYGLNVIGLKRHGFSDEAINNLKKAYKILFREKRTLREALKKIKSELAESPEVERLIEFVEKNKRGICR